MFRSFKMSWVVAVVAVSFGVGCGGFSSESAEGLEGCTGTPNMVCADFNADGQTDLAVVDPTRQTVSVLLNEGNGMLASHVTFDAGNGSTLLAGDFNNDGWVDLAVMNEANGTGTVLRGHGPGGFSQPEAFFNFGVIQSSVEPTEPPAPSFNFGVIQSSVEPTEPPAPSFNFGVIQSSVEPTKPLDPSFNFGVIQS
ncbi:FG-GAP repeat domain-containing protein [Hyalangium rubrum]|uniref:VCBS repeat-containing protein n=1 Tax=Hyalangium rubrum TaxID=3103134 RepID=A0ABU5GYW3_9BACT|nr:VCBS repeat-containing protein [Hyalangium sp. s54d21]MDY7225884.1 VCBS repeat-containing protein [Hyalangium sp. s54d21]